MHMTQDPDDDDGTFSNVDKHINQHGYGDELLEPPSQEPNPAKDDRDLAGTTEKPNCNRRRLFSSHETPPDSAFTETQIAEVQNNISPNTLKKVVSEQNSIPLRQKKQKGRKIKNNKSASQPAPSMIHAQDGPPISKDTSRRVHVAGRPMLPTNLLNAATGAMRSLHDGVLCMKKRRLSENDVSYPVFVAKVSEGKGFVDSTIGRMIVLRFDDIFAMFNLYLLHYTFIRLFSLSMEMCIIRDKTPDIVIVDPFYMRAKILGSVGDRQVPSSYLEGVILVNADKDNFLVPNFPSNDTHCTLILLSPKYSMATYFDSDRQSKKDYTNIKKVLNDALPGYAKSGGTFRRPIRRYGKHVFTHVTTFPCVKQPPGSQKDAYAIPQTTAPEVDTLTEVGLVLVLPLKRKG
ncbi:hypothetical protein ZWY2020_016259 [Hordeum vulgare]|nr:hypothetical protein ZWY2020_016259 [Hordeum vulgare]